MSRELPGTALINRTYAATPDIPLMVRYAALTHPTNRGVAEVLINFNALGKIELFPDYPSLSIQKAIGEETLIGVSHLN